MNQPATLLKTVLLGVVLFFAQSGNAQTAVNIEEDFDLLTAEWLDVSGELKTYNGLDRFCVDPDFRETTVDILGLLHHYDSIVLEILLDPSYDLEISHREYKHTIKDIQSFEEEYNIKEFITFLRESCGKRNELERNKKDLIKESGMYSYDGQILVLETHLRRFLNHIDKKVLAIDDHLHLIHVDQLRPYKPVSENK